MSTLEAACIAAMSREGVLGVLCVDDNGLCLHAAGAVTEAAAGAVAASASSSIALMGCNNAVVTIESPQSKVLLSRSQGATLALFMQPRVSPN